MGQSRELDKIEGVEGGIAFYPIIPVEKLEGETARLSEDYQNSFCLTYRFSRVTIDQSSFSRSDREELDALHSFGEGELGLKFLDIKNLISFSENIPQDIGIYAHRFVSEAELINQKKVIDGWLGKMLH